MGGIDYVREGTGPYMLKRLSCEQCDSTGMTAMKWLPEEFLVKLSEVNVKPTSFFIPKPPNFSGYVRSGVVQYNSDSRHFRTVHMLGRDTTIVLDNGTSDRF